MNTQQKQIYSILSTLSILSIVLFGGFWFGSSNFSHNFSGPNHIFDYLLFGVVTYIVWLPIIMKLGLWSIASHIRPLKTMQPQEGLKVALITTFVPASESLSLLHKTLPAMRAVEYAHDTWLLDEGGDATVEALCHSYGVKYFSRNGKDHYNMSDGKYARKTKGGNHNSWYDSAGNDYDIVAQMDTDFVPNPNFLMKTLGYFTNPKVAWVGTPQIYGNTQESLIARGAAQQTYSFYGPLLRGMAGMETTMLIGANHVIRVKALREVDHYSAHITEDLLTGMKLHANGWKSVYVPEALAIGEGPETWKSYFAQQKRWAYGCMHILFNHSLGLFRSMTPRRILYYFLIQQHYFSGIAMFLSIGCLALYFGLGMQSLTLPFIPFIMLYACVVLMSCYMDLWIQRFNIRPKQERGIMWAGMYIGIVAWPIYLMAFFALFKNKKMTYKVTPKGLKQSKRKQPSPHALFIPHFILACIAFGCFLSSFFTHRDSAIMIFWSLACGLLLLFVPLIPAMARLYKRAQQAISRIRIIPRRPPTLQGAK